MRLFFGGEKCEKKPSKFRMDTKNNGGAFKSKHPAVGQRTQVHMKTQWQPVYITSNEIKVKLGR